jgi:hypothetical protein
MAFPQINIIFKSVAATAMKRGTKGIVFAILKDAVGVKGVYELTTATDIPVGLSAYNKAQLGLIFQGGVTAPRKVIACVQDSTLSDISTSLTVAEAMKFDYLVVPGASAADATAAATSVKGMRTNLAKKVKAVLPNTASDSEAVINFATDNIVVDGTTYAAKDYCARIAGILAGTPLTASVTFTVLPEVDDVPRMSQSNAGTLIDAGKLILFHDGEKIKIARGVNSLTTTSTDKGEQFKKIKIIDILDLIHDDIKRTAEDSYIGKVSNSYPNKCLLINAINAYFVQLENEGLLERGANKAYIDVDAQRTYLKSIGYDVDAMDDTEVKAANTRDKVFLAATVKPVDAMEEITFNVTL